MPTYESIKEFLDKREYYADFNEEIEPGFFNFIKTEGKFYLPVKKVDQKWIEASRNCRRGNCYTDAFNAAKKYSELKYCQGFYRLDVGSILRHAFNLIEEDGENRVLDLTAIKFDIDVREYFGVIIPKDILQTGSLECYGGELRKYYEHARKT